MRTLRNNQRRPRTPEPAAELPETGTVTALTPQRNSGRLNLYVDGVFLFGVDAEIAAQLGLVAGQEVDRARLESARSLDEEKRARDRALTYLAARPHTRAELARKLAQRQFGAEAISRALEYLAQRGWLDDAAFARQYVQEHRSGRGARGQRRLAQELRRKGVAPDLVQAVLAESFAGDEGLDEAAALVRSRLARMSGLDRRTAYRRLAAFLARRGFGHQVITGALSRVLGEWEEG